MMIPELIGCEPVALEEMLDAREARVRCQQQLLKQWQGSLICLTLNIAGPYKAFPLAIQTFREAVSQITGLLQEKKMSVAHFEQQLDKTGPTAFFSVQEDARKIKQWMTRLEEECPLGRLFDIDVLKPDGGKISRREIGCAERKCLICDQAAAVCARSRAHTVDRLAVHTVSIMKRYFGETVCDRIAACAVRALLYEVAVTPKPGLVDRNNNGSHQDMDFYLFLDSTAALLPYFRESARLGFRFAGTPAELFSKLRILGVEAERAMHAATNGVNTHKGAIFLLGILVAAGGRLLREGQLITEEMLFPLSAQIAASSLEDFKTITAENARTSGERLFTQYGLTGVRGEASGGFPSVKNFALPALRNTLADGYGKDEAGTVALLSLMANVSDSTLIHRSSLNIQHKFSQVIRKLMQRRQTVQERISAAWQLDSFMRQQNLSAGGCADLLACAWLTLFLEDIWKQPAGSTTAYAIFHTTVGSVSASITKSQKPE